MPYEVVFSPEAQTDLLNLYDYIASRDGEKRAVVINRILCSGRDLQSGLT